MKRLFLAGGKQMKRIAIALALLMTLAGMLLLPAAGWTRNLWYDDLSEGNNTPVLNVTAWSLWPAGVTHYFYYEPPIPSSLLQCYGSADGAYHGEAYYSFNGTESADATNYKISTVIGPWTTTGIGGSMVFFGAYQDPTHYYLIDSLMNYNIRWELLIRNANGYYGTGTSNTGTASGGTWVNVTYNSYVGTTCDAIAVSFKPGIISVEVNGVEQSKWELSDGEQYPTGAAGMGTYAHCWSTQYALWYQRWYISVDTISDAAAARVIRRRPVLPPFKAWPMKLQ